MKVRGQLYQVSLLSVVELAWGMAIQRSRICVVMDDATLRRRVHRALQGLAHEIVDIDTILEPTTVRRSGEGRVLIVAGARLGGADLTPAILHRVRASEPLVPIIVCVPPRHQLLTRLGDLALAGVDRVVALDAPDEETDLRRDAVEALNHVLPQRIDLGVDATVLNRGVAAELFCARNGYLDLHEEVLAVRFNVDRGTILRAAKREGWQDVQCLIRASRTLHVAAELERPLTRAGVIARSLHFGSASALHHHVKRATGRTVEQLKFGGALRIAVRLWLRRGAVRGLTE